MLAGEKNRTGLSAGRKPSFQHIRQPTPNVKKLYSSSKEILPATTSRFPAKLRHSTSLASSLDLFEDPVNSKWVEPTKWDPCRKRNVLCEYCGGAVSVLKHVDTACAYCNVVAHVRCIDATCTDYSKYSDWICPECQTEIDFSRGQYLNKQTAIIRERNVDIAQTIIAKNFRRYLTRRRYRIFKRSLLHLQSYARIIHRQHIFKEMRKLMLRPLRVEVRNCVGHGIEEDNESTPLLTIAVIDPSKVDKVLWYFCIESQDKINPDFGYSKVLIPGICARHMLIVTLILRGEKRNIILGQATISLDEGNAWLSGGVFDLSLEPPEYFLKEFGNVIESESEQMASIEFHLEALNGLRAECGAILGPNLDTYLKIAHGIKRSNNGMKVIKALSKSKSNNSTSGSESLADGSLSRFWCCICDGYLYMYTRMGAGLRAVVDLKAVALQFILDDTGTSDRVTISIKMAGLPPLVLAVGDHMESWRWRFAILSSYKYAKDPAVLYDIYENRKEMVDMYAELSSDGLKKYIAAQEAKHLGNHKKKEDEPRRIARQVSTISRASVAKHRSDSKDPGDLPDISRRGSSSSSAGGSGANSPVPGGSSSNASSSLLRCETPTSPSADGDDPGSPTASASCSGTPASRGGSRDRRSTMHRMASISAI